MARRVARVRSTNERVGAACAANGLAMGTAVGPGAALHRVAQKGGRWFNCSHELSALTHGYRVAREAAGNIVADL